MRFAPGIGLEVRRGLTPHEKELLDRAHLQGLAPVEAWRVTGTNRQLAYSTHGVFRFFGKFPPPLARHLIECFSEPGDWVLDPMAGSGTTAVEALNLSRRVVVRDISPLSVLLCRVKTTHVERAVSATALLDLEQRLACVAEPLPEPVGLRDAAHWFLPETMRSLGRIRAAIDLEPDPTTRDLLLAAFASTVRRVSKATTEQGRLFLDARKAKGDAWPTFIARFERYAAAVAALPGAEDGRIKIEQCDAKCPAASPHRFRLVIIHPPYFSNYKYSSVNSLELAWLGIAPRGIRVSEIREAFKVGKPEKVLSYLEDLTAVMRSIAAELPSGATLALMMGDTVIKGSYVDVTHRLLRALDELGVGLQLTRLVVRVPQYTEASWVASQRRGGARLGVALYDFVLLLSKREAS